MFHRGSLNSQTEVDYNIISVVIVSTKNIEKHWHNSQILRTEKDN